MLAANSEIPESFMNTPPAKAILPRGFRLGEYEIQDLIGAGGMGEVYRARDLRLRRDVAIKILPPVAATDPDRLRRFEQEAHAIASLNHPNILAIYQFGEHERGPYLVTELLNGETLRQKLSESRLPISKTLEYSVEIARGLAAAHEKGVIHRDLKPENVFVTNEDRVKILDFGLAKMTSSQPPAKEVDGQTAPGLILGTIGYMAPEQLRGQPVDARTDIFAFGAILYEALTGSGAFERPTPAEGIAAILNETPPEMARSGRAVPAELERIAQRCLEKSSTRRFQSASDLGFALESLREPGLKVGVFQRLRQFSLAHSIATAMVLLLTSLAVATVYFYLHRHPKLTERDTIVLADLDNKTGDAVFDSALNQALIIQLEQSPFLKILSDSEVNKALQQMSLPPGTKLSAAVARDVCVRAGSKAYLETSISNFGHGYLVQIAATGCVAGERLAQDQRKAGSKDDVLKTLDSIATKMRSKLGESLTTVQKFNYQGETTTSSLEALKAYSLGNRTLRSSGPEAAVPFLHRALELDPKFAKAYLALGKMYSSMGDSSLAVENTEKAYHLVGQVSEIERLDITAEYNYQVKGDLSATQQAFDSWIQEYPRDPSALHNRANIYMKIGQYEKAIQGFSEAQKLAPDFVYSDISIAFANLNLNRLQAAEAALDKLASSGFSPQLAWPRFYQVAFLEGNTEEMARQLGVGLARTQDRGDALWIDAFTDLYHGVAAKAGEVSSRAIPSQKDAGHSEVSALKLARLGRTYADCGETNLARAAAESALKLSNGRMVKAQAALAFARIGDISRARGLVDELKSNYPSDTLLNRYWLPAATAAIQIKEGQPSDAIATLEPALDYELSWVGPLYPAFLRGEAYLEAHNGPAAVLEFQKVIDHSGIVFNDVAGPLALLKQGQAYLITGEGAKSTKAYEMFFAVWKDADSNLPILIAARKQYAAMQ